MKLSLVLVDDWELRGNGSGDMKKIQFATLARLLEIYEAHGLRASINAEIMQQLHHRMHGAQFPHLAELADRWEHVVTSAYRRGHDVQLHVHSQWEGARYQDGKWVLSGDWSILKYPREVMARMIRECRTYLEDLLRRVDPDYRCVSFRSGAWAIAPNPDILPVLVDEGIVFDMSIVSGIRYNNEVISLDYSKCEEPFLPYYPQMSDARLLSHKEEPLVCVPTLSFVQSRYSIAKKDLQRLRARLQTALRSTTSGGTARPKPAAVQADYQFWEEPRGVIQKIRSRCFPDVTIADLSALGFDLMKEMVAHARRQGRRSGLNDVPVILENHTKDITDFSDIERFARYIARAADIEVITLKELAHRLQRGYYSVRKKEVRDGIAA